MKNRLVKVISLAMAVFAAAGSAAWISGAGAGPASAASVRAATADMEEAEKETAADKTSEADTGAAGKKVYFAAPLFNEAEREYNLKVVAILEKHGYEVFLPQRDGFLAPELEGKTEEEKIEMIFAKDRDEVLKADILFMSLDGRVPDEGACVELGIAYANGKRCYGLKNDARSVELDMDLNPMISGCFKKLFYDLNGEALLKQLDEYLEENAL